MTNNHKPHEVTDRGYLNAVVNGMPLELPPRKTWAYRVTFPSGVEVGDSGFGSFSEAFEAACVFIDYQRKATT